MGYAVIDVETTGLYRADRIIELGAILVDDAGVIEQRIDTLINPGRDVATGGPQNHEADAIHRIRASDVVHAPGFVEIAEWLMHHLTGRVLVAHNARFDLTALQRELVRIGRSLPGPTAAIDTMPLTAAMLGTRSLQGAARALRLDRQGTGHQALADAETAWQIATRLWSQLPAGVGSPGVGWAWPNGDNHVRLDVGEADPARISAMAAALRPPDPVPSTPRLVPRPDARAAQAAQDSYLSTLVSTLPVLTPDGAIGDGAVADAYLAHLDSVIADRLITEDEARSVLATAETLGLGRRQVATLHRRYYAALVQAAHADGVVTALEAAELARVARLLDVDSAGTTTPQLSPPDSPNQLHVAPGSCLTLAPGDRVAFTGAMSCPRSDLESMARNAGLVCGSLTKKTTVLVVADPQSQSGKARKARSYGTLLVSEQVFRDALAALTSPQPVPA